jgi:mono/diheme cytochrome c family protein
MIQWVLGMLTLLALGSCNQPSGMNLQAVKNGQRLYDIHCANCHQQDGAGLAAWIPPLAQSNHLLAVRLSIPCIISNGMKQPIVVNGVEYNQPMPANPRLSEKEITYITNYVEWYFLKNQQTLSQDSVNLLLRQCNQP